MAKKIDTICIEDLVIWTYRDQCADVSYTNGRDPMTPGMAGSVLASAAFRLGTAVDGGAGANKVASDAFLVDQTLRANYASWGELVWFHGMTGTQPTVDAEPWAVIERADEYGYALENQDKVRYAYDEHGNEIYCHILGRWVVGPVQIANQRERYTDWYAALYGLRVDLKGRLERYELTDKMPPAPIWPERAAPVRNSDSPPLAEHLPGW